MVAYSGSLGGVAGTTAAGAEAARRGVERREMDGRRKVLDQAEGVGGGARSSACSSLGPSCDRVSVADSLLLLSPLLVRRRVCVGEMNGTRESDGKAEEIRAMIELRG